MAWTNPHHFINGIPVYFAGGTTWISPGSTTVSGGPVVYSTGGGAVAPVPPAGAPPATPADPRPTEFVEVTDAADACLSYALGRKPEQPPYYTCLVRRQEGRVVTSDTLEAAIRRRHKERAAGVSLDELAVSLVWADTGGVTFLCEGLRVP